VSGCRHFVPLLEPFRDGELSPSEVVDVETHLVECERCSERLRLGEAMRASLKEVVRDGAQVSAAFEERIRLALAAEREREERPDPAHDAQLRMLSWRSIVPIAAAAAVVMVYAASANNRATDVASARANMYQASSPASIEKLLEDLVSNHEHSAGPQFTEQGLLPQLEPEVGVPVKLPNFKQYGARGAREQPTRGLVALPHRGASAHGLHLRRGAGAGRYDSAATNGARRAGVRGLPPRRVDRGDGAEQRRWLRDRDGFEQRRERRAGSVDLLSRATGLQDC
jgi:hypothetical protein